MVALFGTFPYQMAEGIATFFVAHSTSDLNGVFSGRSDHGAGMALLQQVSSMGRSELIHGGCTSSARPMEGNPIQNVVGTIAMLDYRRV